MQQRNAFRSSSINSAPQIYTHPPTIPVFDDEGPRITVFIGNLS